MSASIRLWLFDNYDTESSLFTPAMETRVPVFRCQSEMGLFQAQQSFIKRKGNSNAFYINRKAQMADGSSLILKVEMASDNNVFQNRERSG